MPCCQIFNFYIHKITAGQQRTAAGKMESQTIQDRTKCDFVSGL